MEPSGVWKNLLSGKQAVPTVACPSCLALVPEFRIHSHLDTCLKILEVEPAIAAVEPPSDGGNRGRGRARGRVRGSGRKRREEAELKKDIDDNKRPRNNNDDDDNAAADDASENFYWEYSVSSLAKLKLGNHLRDSHKQALSACGVLQIEGLSAMVVELDRLLADNEDGFQIPALNKRMDTVGQCEAALGAWWEQWATEEWPEGPLPLGFHAGLAQESTTSVPKDPNESIVIEGKLTTEPDKREATEVGLKISNDVMSSKARREGEQLIQTKDSGHSMNHGSIEGKSTELLLTKSDRSEPTAGLKFSNDVMSTKAHFIQTNLSACSNAEHALSITPAASAAVVVEASATEAGPSSPSKASGASPGLQACPICNTSFPPKSSNRDINKHIDECLNDMAGLLD